MIYKVVAWPDSPDFSFAEERAFMVSLREVRTVTGTLQEDYMVQADVNDGDFRRIWCKGTAILNFQLLVPIS